MGMIKRAIAIIIGPGINKLMDMTNACRCISCCAKENWVPCENKTRDGQKVCDWCIGSNNGEYPHCHSIGNAMVKAGWALGRADIKAKDSSWPE